MRDDADLETMVASMSLVGPFDSRDPIETVEAVADALQFWLATLRESPDMVSQVMLRERGRDMIQGEIENMVAGLMRASKEIWRMRLAAEPDAG